jgi:hypothetical protein
VIPAALYWSILLSTGFFATSIGAFYNFSKKPVENKVLFFWFLTRFLTDFSVFIGILVFNHVFIIIMQTSIIIESVLLAVLLKNRFDKDKFKLLLLFPLLIFSIEIVNFIVGGSIIQLGFIFYNLLASILLFMGFIKTHSISYTTHNMLKVLFIFHAVTFIYSLFDYIIRDNIDLMKIVYPLFLLIIVTLNIFYIINSWSPRKN